MKEASNDSVPKIIRKLFFEVDSLTRPSHRLSLLTGSGGEADGSACHWSAISAMPYQVTRTFMRR